jgi:hypothetical protein
VVRLRRSSLSHGSGSAAYSVATDITTPESEEDSIDAGHEKAKIVLVRARWVLVVLFRRELRSGPASYRHHVTHGSGSAAYSVATDITTPESEEDSIDAGIPDTKNTSSESSLIRVPFSMPSLCAVCSSSWSNSLK